MNEEKSNGVLYISGLSASGKTTLAYRIITKLNNINKKVILMDGTEMYNHSILYPFDGHKLVDRKSRSSHSVRIAKWISNQGIIPIVAVIGQPSEKWGESPFAVVVRKSESLGEGDVLAHCEGKLARFKLPKGVAFIELLPRNPNGKVLKRLLREDFPGPAPD